MNVELRKPRIGDLPQYTALFQRTYEVAYVDKKIGLKKEHFSPKIFNNDRNQQYLKSKLLETEKQCVWLAYIAGILVGAITIEDKGSECEISAFYVDPSYQGKGIGKLLWEKALESSKGKDIILDVYAHSAHALPVYRNWGFEIDLAKGEQGVFYRHWPEWPENLNAKAYYMRRKGPA